MRLLYLTEYFQTPDDGGLMRTWALSRFLVRHGHRVEVVAPGVHHMTGELSPELGRHWRRRTEVAGIGVTRVRTWSSFRRGYLQRVLYYLSTPVAVLAAAVTMRGDVVMASSPPFFLGPGALLLARLKLVPFVLEIRDAWLEFASASGMVPRPLVRLLEAQQRWLIRHADRIVAVTPGIERIACAALPPGRRDRVHLVMNGYEEDIVDYALPGRAEQIRRVWTLEGKFVAIFTGTIGLSRDGMTCMRAALRLRHHRDIVFVFVGEGEGKQPMQRFAAEHDLTNCVFVPLQPRHDMPAWMEVASVGLNAIPGNRRLESSLSNKIFEYLGSRIPVVWAGEGDTTDLLEKSGGGISLAPGDDEGMADAIARLQREPALRVAMGEAGHSYVTSTMRRSQLAARLERMLTALVGEPSSAVSEDLPGLAE